MPTNELWPENFWDIKKALVVQYIINIFSVLFAKLLISPKLENLFIFAL